MKKFKKYSKRINNFEVRNHDDNKILYHSDNSLFELIHWYKNPNYNKLEQYYNEGFEDSFLGKQQLKDICT